MATVSNLAVIVINAVLLIDKVLVVISHHGPVRRVHSAGRVVRAIVALRRLSRRSERLNRGIDLGGGCHEFFLRRGRLMGRIQSGQGTRHYRLLVTGDSAQDGVVDPGAWAIRLLARRRVEGFVVNFLVYVLVRVLADDILLRLLTAAGSLRGRRGISLSGSLRSRDRSGSALGSTQSGCGALASVDGLLQLVGVSLDRAELPADAIGRRLAEVSGDLYMEGGQSLAYRMNVKIFSILSLGNKIAESDGAFLQGTAVVLNTGLSPLRAIVLCDS